MMDYPLYRIRWVDSMCTNGWVMKGDIKPEQLEVESVGWLLFENDEQIIVSAHIASECIQTPMAIPKCALVSMELMTKIGEL